MSRVPPIIEKLEEAARREVERISSSKGVLSELYDELLSKLVAPLGKADLSPIGKEFEVSAIDGSCFSKDFLELVAFYGGASAVRAKVKEAEEGIPVIEYDIKPRAAKVVSSCVPMLVYRILESEQTRFEGEEIQNLETAPLTDEELIDNSAIPSAIMHFAEWYLAYKEASEGNSKIILMDRSLSGDLSHLISHTLYKSAWKKGALYGLILDDQPITTPLIDYGRFHFVNEELGLPPFRGIYTFYRMAYELEKRGEVKAKEFVDELVERYPWLSHERIYRSGKEEEGLPKYSIQKGENPYQDKALMVWSGGWLSINREALGERPWGTIKELVEYFARLIFEEGSMVVKDKYAVFGEKTYKEREEERQITVQDLKLLTLYAMYMTIEACWEKRRLLIGIVKDTSATDFLRQFIPICIRAGFVKTSLKEHEAFKLLEVANSDRMALQMVSVIKYEELEVPWATVEYDSCFRTMRPSKEKRAGPYVEGVRRNIITSERLFTRQYVQLTAYPSNKRIRGYVFALERLVDPIFDDLSCCVQLNHVVSGGEIPIRPLIYWEHRPLQKAILSFLARTMEPSNPELLGYSKLLFLADRVIKKWTEEVRRALGPLERLILIQPDLREFLLYAPSYRRRRRRYGG